jgi:CarD family transcriptional regulator
VIDCGVAVARDDGGELSWSQRYKANMAKLESGDVALIVEVIRDLADRDAHRGLSAGEKRMLARARTILIQEG